VFDDTFIPLNFIDKVGDYKASNGLISSNFWTKNIYSIQAMDNFQNVSQQAAYFTDDIFLFHVMSLEEVGLI
jgi:hypothetical protein